MDLSMTLPTMLPHIARQTLAWCREIDDGPWASLAVPERITYTSHDWTVELAAAAALTERVRLWTTIVILPAHDEVAVAKQLASIDVLSDGRLTVGVGVGGREHDYRAIGGSFDRRWQRMDEQVAAHAAHLGGRAAVRRRRPGRAAAGAGRGPPVIAGVMGPKAIARAAHWADGVDGAWTMDGDRDAMAAAFDADPRRVGRRRPHRRAAPLVEHLVRARRRRRGAPARVRVRLHEDLRRGRRGVGGERGGLLHPRRAAARASTTPRDAGRRRVLPRAHHLRSRRAGPHPGRPVHLAGQRGPDPLGGGPCAKLEAACAPSSRFGTLFRSLVTFVVAIVIGGVAVGACLAALIPGTVEIATAHHYTASRSGTCRGSRSRPPSTGRRRHADAAASSASKRHDPITRSPRSAAAGERGDRHRRPLVLDQRRHRPRRGVPGVRHQRRRPGGIEQGGSTITQQLVKNRILTRQARREPQDQGDRGRAAAEREVLEGEDPRRVPEHRVLR